MLPEEGEDGNKRNEKDEKVQEGEEVTKIQAIQAIPNLEDLQEAKEDLPEIQEQDLPVQEGPMGPTSWEEAIAEYKKDAGLHPCDETDTEVKILRELQVGAKYSYCYWLLCR